MRSARDQHAQADIDEIGSADPFQYGEGERGGGEQGREAECGGRDVYEATRADAQRGRDAAAPSELGAAADDVGRVRTGRHVQQETGENENPEIVDAGHR